MKRSTASRGAFAILVALPLLPVCGIVVNGPPAMVWRIYSRGEVAKGASPRWGF